MGISWGDVGRFAGDVLTGGSISKIKAARANNRAQQRALLAAGKISQDQYNKNMDLLERQFDAAEGYQQPYLGAGQRALGRMESFVDEYGAQQPGYVDTMGARPESFKPSEFNFQITPELQQRIDAARNSVQTSAAAKGLLGSSGALKAIQQGSADIAQQGINEAFNRHMQTQGLAQSANLTDQNLYTTDRGFQYGKYGDDVNRNIDALTRKYNALSGMTNMGQAAANNLSNLSTQRGSALAGEGSNLAEIQANLAMGRANATSAKNNAVGQAYGQGATNLANTALQVGGMFAGMPPGIVRWPGSGTPDTMGDIGAATRYA